MARSISNSAELMAIEKGYFREFGIKPEIELIEFSANAIALLAQNRFQIVAGGISRVRFQCAREGFADHHRDRPRQHADRP